MLRRRHPAARVRIAGPVKGVRGPRGTWQAGEALSQAEPSVLSEE